MLQILIATLLLVPVARAEQSLQSAALAECKAECPNAKRPHELHMCITKLSASAETEVSISPSCKASFEALQEFKKSGHSKAKK